MKFPSIHPTLYIKEITLKKITYKDLVELEEIVSYHPARKDSAEEKLRRVEDTFKEKSAITWGMFLDNELIGTIGFYRGFENDRGEIGYVTRENFRRKGYTSKGVKRIIDFALKEMQLQNIVAYTSDWNDASIQTLQKLNFEQVDSDNDEFIKFKLRRQE